MAKRTVNRKTIQDAGQRNGHVRAGVLKLSIDGGELDGQTVEMDASIVKAAAWAVAQQHDLQTNSEGLLVVTPEFLRDLVERLVSFGYPKLTPTVALVAWEKAESYFQEQQKKTRD